MLLRVPEFFSGTEQDWQSPGRVHNACPTGAFGGCSAEDLPCAAPLPSSVSCCSLTLYCRLFTLEASEKNNFLPAPQAED